MSSLCAPYAFRNQGCQRRADQRLHLARDEVTDCLDVQRSTLTACHCRVATSGMMPGDLDDQSSGHLHPIRL
ncbi:hypothetical protein TNCV_3445931 [Trichonephila clavipes]|nr:hypothetical protein TNCV_3445931 [Trichonephila clavipes]